MQPRIQYVKTADGVSIAYYTIGSGPALIDMPPAPFSHIQLEWSVPERRSWYERLAESHTLVRYDSRGSGLSDRNVGSQSLEASILDLNAVIDRLGLQRFDLLAQFYAGAPAVRFAAVHPERLSHLVLWHTFAKSDEFLEGPQTQALLTLVDKDWELFTETLASARLGWSAGDEARRFARFVRETVTPEVLLRSLQEMAGYDVESELAKVRTPTLVLRRGDFQGLDASTSTRLAAAIPNARLTVLEGDTGAMFASNSEDVLDTLQEFLTEDREGASRISTAAAEAPAGLTKREIEVLRLLSSGRTNKEIAEELVLSVHTVERHLANVYRKLGVRSRSEATAYALTHDLGPAEPTT